MIEIIKNNMLIPTKILRFVKNINYTFVIKIYLFNTFLIYNSL
jgi:hypothetical protein